MNASSRARWIKQTTFFDPSDPDNPNKGNCGEACVASLLNIPLPEKFGRSGDPCNYWGDFLACLEGHGYAAMHMGGGYQPDFMYLASGPSPRGGCSHMVIMREGRLVHDPHPSNAGLLSVDYVWILSPIDPGVMRIDRGPAST